MQVSPNNATVLAHRLLRRENDARLALAQLFRKPVSERTGAEAGPWTDVHVYPSSVATPRRGMDVPAYSPLVPWRPSTVDAGFDPRMLARELRSGAGHAVQGGALDGLVVGRQQQR